METTDESVIAENARAYKESLKLAKPELDIALLFRILDMVNESSEVKIAIEPIGDEGEWTTDAPPGRSRA